MLATARIKRIEINNMKIEYVIPEEQKRHIEDLQSKISEIEMEYIERIQKTPFAEIQNQIRKTMSEDKNIEVLRKTIAYIYERSAFKILVEVENEEELERLKQMWRESNVRARNANET